MVLYILHIIIVIQLMIRKYIILCYISGRRGNLLRESVKEHVHILEVVKDSVVYLNSTTDVISHGELYVSRPDGINKRVLDDEIWDFVIDQDYIYYQYCYDTVGAGLGGHALHRMDVNGANSTVVAYEVNSPY